MDMDPDQHLQASHRAKRPRLGERTMVACLGCKQKKLKCDDKIPQCQNCLRNGRQCLIEDPGTGLPRPRDYVQSLETKIQYLESLLNTTNGQCQQQQHLGQTIAITVPEKGDTGITATPAFQATEINSIDTHASDYSAGHTETADGLSADVALLCVHATGREPAYFGPSSSVSFSRVVSSSMKFPKRQQGGTAQSNKSNSVEWQGPSRTSVGLPPPPPPTFPPPALRAILCEAYLDNIHPQYPFLHWPTFLAWQDLCVDAHSTESLSSCPATPLFFVWIIYAIGARTLGVSYYAHAEVYYSKALGHQAAVLDLDSLESVQSLLACGVYSIRSPIGPSLWKLAGMAMRQCVGLGYHRSVAKFRRDSNPLAAEISKRCFWVAYDLDRQSSFILGRPVGLPDDYIDVELPLDINDSDITATGIIRAPRASHHEPYTDMTGALHVIKLRQLWSKIGHFVYPPLSKDNDQPFIPKKTMLESLAAELEEWHENMPDQISSASQHEPISTFASRTWFQLAYSYSTLILYRYWLVNRPIPGEEEFSDRVYEICYNRSREMCSMYRRLYSRAEMQFTWGLVHILFLGGMTFIYCIWKLPNARKTSNKTEVINTCMACHTVLVIIAARWDHAAPFRDIFETLSERTIQLVCSGVGDDVPIENNNTSLYEPLRTDMEMPSLKDWLADTNEQAILEDQDYLWELLDTMGVVMQ